MRPFSPAKREYDLTTNQTAPSHDQDALQIHPLAEYLPSMSEDEFNQLVTDIEANGIHNPIVLYKGMILDGRHRYEAWKEAIHQVPSLYLPRREFKGTDPAAFVISQNLQRRMLNESQRAMIMARLTSGSGRGKPRKVLDGDASAVLTQAKGRKLLNVSEDSGQRAKQVLKTGTKTLISRVDRGEIPVALAARVALMPPEEQEIIHELPEGQVRRAWRARRREQKEHLLARATAVAATRLGTSLFGVIYADPPWLADITEENSTRRRTLDTYGETMSQEELAQLKVPAAPDCVLFMWYPPKLQREAMAVTEAWGFTYSTNLVWVRNKAYREYWTHNVHDHLLIATKGQVPTPTDADRVNSAQSYDAHKLKFKPIQFAAQIETMFPTTPRLSMFLKGPPIPGWSVWNYENAEVAG